MIDIKFDRLGRTVATQAPLQIHVSLIAGVIWYITGIAVTKILQLAISLNDLVFHYVLKAGISDGEFKVDRVLQQFAIGAGLVIATKQDQRDAVIRMAGTVVFFATIQEAGRNQQKNYS
jgi:phosphoribosylaminoimidazole (AIR) synthetase